MFLPLIYLQSQLSLKFIFLAIYLATHVLSIKLLSNRCMPVILFWHYDKVCECERTSLILSISASGWIIKQYSTFKRIWFWIQKLYFLNSSHTGMTLLVIEFSTAIIAKSASRASLNYVHAKFLIAWTLLCLT